MTITHEQRVTTIAYGVEFNPAWCDAFEALEVTAKEQEQEHGPNEGSCTA